jgi:hypothetical protein
VSLVCGRRTEDLTFTLVVDFHARTEGRLLDLMLSDENPASASAILEVYGTEVVPERTGRPRAPYREIPEGLTSATVHKEREGGRVVSVEQRLVYGTAAAVTAALAALDIGATVNTAHEERFHGTDRNRNARQVRQAYPFAQDWEVQVAVTRLVRDSYNFCWPVRTRRVRGRPGAWEPRTPAMSAGLTDQVWSVREWLTLPGVKKINDIPNIT